MLAEFTSSSASRRLHAHFDKYASIEVVLETETARKVKEWLKEANDKWDVEVRNGDPYVLRRRFPTVGTLSCFRLALLTPSTGPAWQTLRPSQ